MKPLGTITMCFPYIDEVTKRTLKTVMKEAENYADFTVRLCDKVLAESSNPLLEFFAFFFTFHVSDYNLIDRLDRAGKVADLARPLHIIVKYRRGESVDFAKMNQALIESLKLAPNDWVACLIYLKWRIYAELNFPDSEVNLRVMEKLDQTINQREDLEFFRSYLLRIQGIQLMFDFRSKEELEVVREALRIAQKYDDQISVVDMLSVVGGGIKFTDTDEGLSLLKSSRELAEKLGYRYRVGHYHLGLAHILAQRLEFDSTIENLLEFIRVRESLGLSAILTNTLLAFYYNLSGNGEEALRRVDLAFNSSESLRMTSSFAIAQRAFALTNLQRYHEARSELEVSKELATSSGVTWYRFLWCQLVEGILERNEDNHVSAMTTFEDVLNFEEEEPVPLVHIMCLLNLAGIEIEILDLESLAKPSDSSGPWMQRFKTYVEEDNFPGLVAQHAILKARLFERQKKYSETIKLLSEVIKISNLPGLSYLRTVVTTSFPAYAVKQ